MKQVLVGPNGVVVEEVPVPTPEPGRVLVRSAFSAISAGTELSGLAAAEVPVWKRAAREPVRAARAAKVLLEGGVGAVRDRLAARAATGQPTGYSVAGTVVGVGPGIHDLRVGDRVACAGAGVANHAAVVSVPRNLVVSVPDGVSLADASTVTLGAIALQGVRRAEPTLGESFAVIGMGILGQITAQLLRVAGNRVVAMDLDDDRLRLAQQLGCDVVLRPGEDAPTQVDTLTGGVGLDGVIITASTPLSDVVSTAFSLCRKKGRVVLVGDVGLDLHRADIYEKELDFLVSTSYGPGRYDRRYEDDGLDYPIGHVRWTENRNMEAVLAQMASGQLDVGALRSATFDISDAALAYDALRTSDPRPLIVLLSYDEPAETSRVVEVRTRRQRRASGVRVGLIGAGSFATSVHLPNLRSDPNGELVAVCSRTGASALAVARTFGAAYCTSDVDELLADDSVDAVLVSTRHHLHADLVCRGLQAGKHVLVEKPLALSYEQLDDIDAVAEDRPDQVLTVGFNRRFAPMIQRVSEVTTTRREPLVLTYRMDAGRLPDDHWTHGPEGGGRNLGEACHVYDLFTALVDAPVLADGITANRLRPATGWARGDDNFVTSMTFADGSVACLTYTSLGGGEQGKERLEVFCDGKTTVVDDYRTLVAGTRIEHSEGPVDKGHAALLGAFLRAVRVGGPDPIPRWHQRQATEIALRVEDALGRPSAGPAAT